MWPSWTRSPRRDPSFASSSSFKDLRSLFTAESPPALPPDPSSHPSTPSSAAAESPKKPPPSIFHRVRVATAALRSWRSVPSPPPTPAPEKRIVVYFTSLRVVRKTFEDCRVVISILRGFRVAVDERDLSMDSRFLGELKGLLGKRHLALPRVFIGGRYVGGADEIRQLHETGDLRRHIEGAPPADAGECPRCGGVTFVLCQGCDGSHKFYSEKAGGFRSCAACNENGLVRCPDCCAREAT